MVDVGNHGKNIECAVPGVTERCNGEKKKNTHIWKIFHHDGCMLEMSVQNSLLYFEVKKGEIYKMRTET